MWLPWAFTLLVTSGRTNDFCKVGVRRPEAAIPTLLLVEAALFLRECVRRLPVLLLPPLPALLLLRLSSNGFRSPCELAFGVTSPPSPRCCCCCCCLLCQNEPSIAQAEDRTVR